MPEKLYETFNPDAQILSENENGHTFSFNEASIREIAKDNDSPVYTHYAHSFFQELSEAIARGEEPINDISKKELAELFCELYKV